MSSMRNAVQRRNHKERAQPVEREKWGILEKHKDYSLRAKDYNAKQKRLKALRQKAAERNPDEFHFAMMSSTNDKGIRRTEDLSRRLNQETVKLLKTQDAAYLRTVLQSTRKTRAALEQELIQSEAILQQNEEAFSSEKLPAHRRLQFVENPVGENEHRRLTRTEIRELADPVGSHLSSQTKHAAPSTRKNNRNGPKKIDSDDEDYDILAESGSDAKPEENEQRELDLASLRNRLEAFKRREKALTLAEQELELQRGRMQNSVGSVNKNGVKFKIRGRKR